MWDTIMKDFLGPEEAISLSKDKKAKVKASLQMKVHRGVLRHGKWPECNMNAHHHTLCWDSEPLKHAATA
jgi:hypothetical protein